MSQGLDAPRVAGSFPNSLGKIWKLAPTIGSSKPGLICINKLFNLFKKLLLIPKSRRAVHNAKVILRRIATKVILQDYESSYSDRLKKLKLFPISYWLEIKDIVFYYKCKAGLYDLDIDKYIERPYRRDRSTRSSTGDFLRPNLCRITLFRNSYFNRIVYLWNCLPSDIKSSSSVYILKAKLYEYYFNKLITVFDADRCRTWNTLCSNCRSLQINCCS